MAEAEAVLVAPLEQAELVVVEPVAVRGAKN